MRTVDIIRFGKKMMYVGEEYQVLVSVLKVFCSIGEKKWLHWIQKVDLLDDGSRTKVTPVGKSNPITQSTSYPIRNNANSFIANVDISTNQLDNHRKLL